MRNRVGGREDTGDKVDRYEWEERRRNYVYSRGDRRGVEHVEKERNTEMFMVQEKEDEKHESLEKLRKKLVI